MAENTSISSDFSEEPPDIAIENLYPALIQCFAIITIGWVIQFAGNSQHIRTNWPWDKARKNHFRSPSHYTTCHSPSLIGIAIYLACKATAKDQIRDSQKLIFKWIHALKLMLNELRLLSIAWQLLPTDWQQAWTLSHAPFVPLSPFYLINIL